jgi:N-carbamoylputrescine amidase
MARRKVRSPSQVVRVGLTQMACGDDPKRNRAKQLTLLERAATEGATVLCTQELFASQYFCQVEDHRFFALAETIPGPTTEAVARLARTHRVVVVASLFERRAAGLYHNTAVVIDTDGRSWASTARCTSRTTRSTTRSSTSRQATPASAPGRRRTRRLACSCAGTSGSRKARASRRCRAPRCSSTPPPSAGTRQRRPSTAARSTTRGSSCSAATPSPTAASSAPRTASATNWSAAPMAAPSTRGHRVLGTVVRRRADGQVVARAPVARDEVLVVDCDLAQVEVSRTHWPFLRDRRIDAYGDLTRRFVDGRRGDR